MWNLLCSFHLYNNGTLRLSLFPPGRRKKRVDWAAGGAAVWGPVDGPRRREASADVPDCDKNNCSLVTHLRTPVAAAVAPSVSLAILEGFNKFAVHLASTALPALETCSYILMI